MTQVLIWLVRARSYRLSLGYEAWRRILSNRFHCFEFFIFAYDNLLAMLNKCRNKIMMKLCLKITMLKSFMLMPQIFVFIFQGENTVCCWCCYCCCCCGELAREVSELLSPPRVPITVASTRELIQFYYCFTCIKNVKVNNFVREYVVEMLIYWSKFETQNVRIVMSVLYKCLYSSDVCTPVMLVLQWCYY